MKKLMLSLAFFASVFSFTALGQDMSHGADNFYKSTKVTTQKVSFNNQYKMKIVGNCSGQVKLATVL